MLWRVVVIHDLPTTMYLVSFTLFLPHIVLFIIRCAASAFIHRGGSMTSYCKRISLLRAWHQGRQRFDKRDRRRGRQEPRPQETETDTEEAVARPLPASSHHLVHQTGSFLTVVKYSSFHVFHIIATIRLTLSPNNPAEDPPRARKDG